MNILFDSQIFTSQQFGGISRYFSEIMHGIEQHDTHKLAVAKIYSRNQHLLDKNLVKYSAFLNLPHFRGKARIHQYLQQQQDKLVASLIRKAKFDVFHPTYYDASFLQYFTDRPFVLTVHDMIHEQYLDHVLGKTHLETINKSVLIPRASHIIAVSEQTKQDILKFYPTIAEEKISVVYHGNSLWPNASVPFHQPKSKYLLYVGQRAHYKNFAWLLNNVSIYLTEKNMQLICAGGGSFSAAEMEQINELGLQLKVSQLPIANDQVLVGLYSNAYCLVLPSLHEGFGIPILEAFACKCPVLANSTSCLPEIGGSAALYFDATNGQTIVSQLLALEQPEIRAELIEEGQKQLYKFSWTNSLNAHLRIYNSLI